ncbi:hypothetical protein BLNAU_14913 [Blattamonas nauphoetae]|uniref:Uncharacterized protein n=1 Tax=Blattamonas nauphoetae TaxID=2049346 RepID=A0ABQ9XIL4_9EUKA|nr:hypothetical protein BLNAU_14913 [Blattamonas nauphoetae]
MPTTLDRRMDSLPSRRIMVNHLLNTSGHFGLVLLSLLTNTSFHADTPAVDRILALSVPLLSAAPSPSSLSSYRLSVIHHFDGHHERSLTQNMHQFDFADERNENSPSSTSPKSTNTPQPSLPSHAPTILSS